jgi:hypothetical protein
MNKLQHSVSVVVANPVATLKAVGNVRRFVEHTNYHRWFRGAVGNPIPPRLQPGMAQLYEARIRTGGGQSASGVTFNSALGLGQRGQKSTCGTVALSVFEVP